MDLRDNGAQFAHIAGPGVGQEQFDQPHPARQLGARSVFNKPAPAIARGVLRKDGAQQQAQIFAALDQGRQSQFLGAQAVAQRGAQGLGLALGGGDDAQVHALHRAAEHLDFALLKRAQQLGLQRLRCVAHLIEKQHAIARLLKIALAMSLRSGVGAAPGAEQAGRRQFHGHSRHVDGHPGTSTQRTASV